jgi:hypothetical protein
MSDSIPNPDPTPQELGVLAAGLLQDLRAIRERIPHFVLPHASHPKLTGLATRVPQAAVEAGFAACSAKEALAKSIDVPAARFDEEYSAAFAELRDELKTLHSGLDYTIRLKRFSVGQATLRVLNIARRLAKGPENAHLRSHIEVMEKALQHRRNAKKPVEPPAAA